MTADTIKSFTLDHQAGEFFFIISLIIIISKAVDSAVQIYFHKFLLIILDIKEIRFNKKNVFELEQHCHLVVLAVQLGNKPLMNVKNFTSILQKKKREETCISKLKLEQEEEHKNPLTRITTKSHKTFCTEFYYHPEKNSMYAVKRMGKMKERRRRSRSRKMRKNVNMSFFNIQ